jgi:hypothetical protein
MRSEEEILDIVNSIKEARNTRDSIIVERSKQLENSNGVASSRLYSLRHVKEIAQDTYVCYKCILKLGADNIPIGMIHHTYELYDKTIDGEIVNGLYTLLKDESFNVELNYTIDNLE